jgi:hypothetical protein
MHYDMHFSPCLFIYTVGWGHGKFDQKDLQNAHYRLNTVLDIPGGETNEEKALKLKRSKFGLGDRRSLDQLIHFSGIDLRHKKPTIDGKNRCGNLQFVPFTENPKGVNYIPQFDADENPLDLPYEKSSVWYDPRVDGVGAGLVSRQIVEENEDSADVQARQAEEEAAHDAHRKEANELAGGSLHEHHQALAAVMEAEGNSVGAANEHREVMSSAALAAQQMDKDGVSHVFPPLLRRGKSLGVGVPKGRFSSFASTKLTKHGIEHLPLQVKLAVLAMVLGLCFFIIAAGGGKRKRRTK